MAPDRCPAMSPFHSITSSARPSTEVGSCRFTVNVVLKYLTWAEGQPGRYELLDGVAPEALGFPSGVADSTLGAERLACRHGDR
jgi:hypothetical protein